MVVNFYIRNGCKREISISISIDITRNGCKHLSKFITINQLLIEWSYVINLNMQQTKLSHFLSRLVVSSTCCCKTNKLNSEYSKSTNHTKTLQHVSHRDSIRKTFVCYIMFIYCRLMCKVCILQISLWKPNRINFSQNWYLYVLHKTKSQVNIFCDIKYNFAFCFSFL